MDTLWKVVQILIVVSLLIYVLCVFCAFILQKKRMTPHFRRKNHARKKHWLLIVLIVFLAGCSSPALSLRTISGSKATRYIDDTVRYILENARNAALSGDRYTMARFTVPESDVQQIARGIKKADWRFRVETEKTDHYITLFVRW